MTDTYTELHIPYALKPMGRRVTVHGDGTASVSGIDYGPRSKVRVHSKNDQAIVLKVEGHMTWGGNGSPRIYVSPQLLVFNIIDTDINAEGMGVYNVTPSVEIDLGRNKS